MGGILGAWTKKAAEDTEEFIGKLRDVLSGRLPKPEPRRLLTTPQIVETLIQALDSSIDERTEAPAHGGTTGDLGAAKY